MGDIPICIDISHHQGFPDFREVRDAGVLGMIHKATEGTSFVDQNRAENCSSAIGAGIVCATYHWLKPGDAADQMKFYMDVVQPVSGERMVIDYEEDGCTLDDLHEAVQILLNDPRDLQVTVYSGHLLKEQLGSDHDKLLAEYTDLWLAQYTSGTPSWSTETYPQWKLWQYSEEGQVPGIDDAFVDFDNFNGESSEFLKWMSPKGAEPQPEPQPVPVPPTQAPVIVNVSSDSAKVVVMVNGTVMRPQRKIRAIRRGPDIGRNRS